jgi:hypothetical protein
MAHAAIRAITSAATKLCGGGGDEGPEEEEPPAEVNEPPAPAEPDDRPTAELNSGRWLRICRRHLGHQLGIYGAPALKRGESADS